VQPVRLRSISACGKLRPCVRRTHRYGVTAAGCDARSGLYERRPLVRTTMSTAATATTPVPITTSDSAATPKMNGPNAEVVTLKLEWNSPTNSTLYPVLLYSHIITTLANI
jgi:hypothetical protein